MVEEQPQTRDPSVTRQRHSRLVSNSSSVMTVSAIGIQAGDKHKISNNEAILHMVKATIGGGFLAMPEAFSNAGLLVGSVGTMILGLAVLNMMSSIVRMSQAVRSGRYAAKTVAEHIDKALDGAAVSQGVDNGHGKSPDKPRYAGESLLPPMDYPETVAAVFQHGARGRFSRWAPFAKSVTSTTLVCTYYGVNIIYVCIIARTCKQLVDQYTTPGTVYSWAESLNGLSIHWYPLITALLIFPVGMVRLIKYLVPFSVIANLCLFIGASAVFYFILWDDGQDPLKLEERAKLVVWPATHWSLFTGSTLCSMEGVGMLLHIENAMKTPLELAGPPTYTLHRSMVIIILINGLLGLFGYIRYGERCTGSISLNLPSGNKLSEAVKIMIAVGILFTYGLQLTVTADLTWQRLRNMLIKNPKDHETGSTKEEDGSSLRFTIYYYVMRFFLILGTILIATAVPDIGPLVSLVGSIGFSILGLIVPVLMETVWYWYPEHGDEDEDEQDVCGSTAVAPTNGACGEPKGPAVTAVSLAIATAADETKKTNRRRCFRNAVRHFKNVFLLALSVFALIGGTYYNVYDIVEHFNSNGHTPDQPATK